MRILFLSHNFYPFIGGIEINSEILANAFVNAGHELRLATWTKDTGDKKFIFPIIRNPNPLTLLKEFKWADLIFENNPSLRLSWPSFFSGKPRVVAICTWISRGDGRTGWQDRLKFLWLRKATAVIAVSEAVRKRCWQNATVISNPYNNKLFRIIPSVEKSVDFVFLGRLVTDKGADLAIRALSLLIKNGYTRLNGNSKTILTIIGDGPERSRLENLAAEENIQENVQFRGSLTGDQLVKCLNMHKYIIIPSLWEEPFGNVALEGMACGCVPITSDGGGLPDAIGDAGLSFSRGNVHSFFMTIKKIIHEEALEQQLLVNARDHLAKHTMDVVGKKYLSVLEKAIS